LATLITPSGQQFPATPQDFTAGFTQQDMGQMIQADCKAFPLQSGELLLVGALGCNPSADVKNETATRYLRNAIADPGGEVCGCALLLAPYESDSLSPSAKRALFLDRVPDTPIVLLLDRNEGFRSVMALGLLRGPALLVGHGEIHVENWTMAPFRDC
jgi:hypothetical protein